MKKFFLITGMLVTGILVLSGQTAEEETIRLKQSMVAGEIDSVAELPLKPSDKKNIKGSWNYFAGSSFTYLKGYGSAMEFYVAPVYTLPLTDRWSLHGGVLASHYTGINMPGHMDQGYASSGSGLAVFGAASYRMSERLMLHGAGVKHLVSGPVSPLSSNTMDHLTVGATYKLGNNISIGASVHMIQGHDYYRGSPFQTPPMPGSPFQSPFGW
ncbi:MAG: hypothetical protein V2B15_08115 [Bacteroidota bacterium]